MLCYLCTGTPRTALAIAVVPFAADDKMEGELTQVKQQQGQGQGQGDAVGAAAGRGVRVGAGAGVGAVAGEQ